MTSPLRNLRILRGLSQDALAKALGVSRRALGRWERAEAVPGQGSRRQLERQLEMTEDDVQEVAVAAWRGQG